MRLLRSIYHDSRVSSSSRRRRRSSSSSSSSSGSSNGGGSGGCWWSSRVVKADLKEKGLGFEARLKFIR